MQVRFDDTNPTKEKDEYTQNIIKDMQTLGLKYKEITYTSDYFPQARVRTPMPDGSSAAHHCAEGRQLRTGLGACSLEAMRAAQQPLHVCTL